MEDFYAAILVMALLLFIIFTFTLGVDFNEQQTMVKSIVYNYDQMAAKKGIVYDSLINDLMNELRPYGIFDITITAKKYTGPSTTETITNADVINKDLRELGYDSITITALSTKRHAYGRILSLGPSGSLIGDYDLRVGGLASAYIE